MSMMTKGYFLFPGYVLHFSVDLQFDTDDLNHIHDIDDNYTQI